MSRYIDHFVRNDREQILASMAEKLAKPFASRAEEHDRAGSFPFQNFEELKEAGYLKLTVPVHLGGGGISLYELVLLQERLGYGDGATALAVGWHLGQVFHFGATGKWQQDLFEQLCDAIIKDGNMINTFASEASTGSPSRGGVPETLATAVEGGWLLTGRKTFSTLSPILDRFVVTAYVPAEGITAEFLVRRSAEVSLIETWDTLGMRATGSHDIVLNGAFVAQSDRIAGGGSDDGGGWLLHIPACYLGIALAARDYALQYARTYSPNSIGKPISSLPGVQQSIGQMELELRSARTVLFAIADRWDKEKDSRSALRAELGLAKHVATNAAIRVVDQAMRIVGGASLSRSCPLERYYRDVRAGLHNPPMDNSVIQMLAVEALKQ